MEVNTSSVSIQPGLGGSGAGGAKTNTKPSQDSGPAGNIDMADQSQGSDNSMVNSEHNGSEHEDK